MKIINLFERSAKFCFWYKYLENGQGAMNINIYLYYKSLNYKNKEKNNIYVESKGLDEENKW